MKNAITILNDEETYTNLEGCTVALLGDADLERIDQGASLRTISPQMAFDLSNPVHLRLLADRIERSR
jgi:hypothetical protein